MTARTARTARTATRRSWPRALRLPVAVAAAVTIVAGVALPPAQAVTYRPITGSGSTWSANAVQQWATEVKKLGITVNFNANGSTQGRQDFYNRTSDFAVSEIPYGLTDRGVRDDPPHHKFAYMPIVAGGTSLMYNLKIGTKRVDNLRLSGDVVAKIFTGVIKVWSDPAIKADNPGLTLPARKIIPVVRSDGSGTTAQFTLWMSKQYPAIWNAYCAKAGRATPCGLTSFYPVTSGSGFTAQNGSVGVSGYVASPTSEGAITYVEYSYARNRRFPVVKLLNKSNYYVLPTAQNVAVGLLKAQINNNASSQDYLTQILDGVYANPDPRAYPMSSYSYMVLPTQTTPSFDTEKGKTLAAFGAYFLCSGQQNADKLGYSPLPKNLVQAGAAQIARIPGQQANFDISKCNNPTFSADGSNRLAKTAPMPPACDRKGPTQCASGGSTQPVGNGGGSGGGGGGTGGGAGGGGNGTAGGGTGTTGPGSTTGSGGGPVVDPDTGEVISAGNDGTTAAAGDVAGLPVSLAADYAGGRTALMTIAAILLLGVTLGPPLIARRLDRGRSPMGER